MRYKLLSIIFAICLFLSTSADAQYTGNTFAIDLSRGGLNHGQNIDNVPAYSMVEGSRNINIHKGGRSKRGGTDNVNGSVIGGTPRIWGVYQFRLQNGNTFILTADANGEILKDYDDASPLKTGLTIDRPVHFITFNNLCIICTGNDLPQVWDGAAGSTTDIVNEAVDWAGGNYPRKMIIHGRGSSERLWAIYGKTDPNTVYASDLNAGDGSTEPDFVTGVLTFYIDTGDGFGILNGVEFGDRLVLAGKSQTYIIDDTDTDTANWGYNKSQWEGGTASDRLFIAVTNDIVSMDESGTVFSVVTSQNYGDYIASSLTRTKAGAPFMDEFIREQVKLSAIDDFHMVYDPVLRQIYIFIVRPGQTDVDTALCYFIDRGPEEGWIIKDNKSFDSGFKASSSTLVRKAVGDLKIYTGGMDDGFVWELETTAKNDNDAAYASGFKTVPSHFGSSRDTKRYDYGWILAQATGNFTFLVDIWVDGLYIKQESAIFTVSGSVYGTAVYGTGAYGGVIPKEASFDIGETGKRIQYNVFNNNANEDIFATGLQTDFENLGRLHQ